MGYTHYWSLGGKATKEVEKTYQIAIEQCNKVILAYNMRLKILDLKHPFRLSGFSAHCETGKYKGIEVNGTKEFSHETFTMRETFQDGTDFCKTNEKPYDDVVVACLIILKHYLGDNFNVESDGDELNWIPGKILAEDVLGISLIIPKSIRRMKFKIMS